MSQEFPQHLTYLLRLWCAGSAQEPAWRAMLVNPDTGERRAFGDLGSLFAFLEEKTHRAASSTTEELSRAETAPGDG